MMKKKWMPHVLAAVALALFVGLGLASDGTTPTGGGCATNCTWNTETDTGSSCLRPRCATTAHIRYPPRTVRCNC